LAIALFVSSGRLDWLWTWAYLGVGLRILALNVVILPAELIAERGQPGGNVKRWEKTGCCSNNWATTESIPSECVTVCCPAYGSLVCREDEVKREVKKGRE